MQDKIVVGLDIGTTKIAALIAEMRDNQIHLLGLGTYPSYGLRRGHVVDMEQTIKSIRKAIDKAENMAGVQVEDVYVGIAGDHIRGVRNHAIVAVGRDGHEVNSDDVRRVLDAAKAITVPFDREIIHIIPQDFTVDNQKSILNPVGLNGSRLEVDVYVVMGAVTSAQNIYKSVSKAGYRVRDLVLEPLASSFAVINEHEKKHGVALIDIGGGTTDMAIFAGGSLREVDMIGLAGQQITNDITYCLQTSPECAESLKKEFGCALNALVADDELVVLPRMDGRDPKTMPRKGLAKIIEARMVEILNLVYHRVEESNLINELHSGIVITGGGSLLQGLSELSQRIFDLPVRIGYPIQLSGPANAVKSPIYATGIGLVQYGFQREEMQAQKVFVDEGQRMETSTVGDGPEAMQQDAQLYSKITDRMRRWLDEFF